MVLGRLHHRILGNICNAGRSRFYITRLAKKSLFSSKAIGVTAIQISKILGFILSVNVHRVEWHGLLVDDVEDYIYTNE